MMQRSTDWHRMSAGSWQIKILYLKPWIGICRYYAIYLCFICKIEELKMTNKNTKGHSAILKTNTIQSMVPTNPNSSLMKHHALVSVESLLDFICGDIFTTNPRQAAYKSGSKATIANIMDSLINKTSLYPFMTGGITLSFFEFDELQRSRLRVSITNALVDGILDGGHNCHAIIRGVLQALWVGEEIPPHVIFNEDKEEVKVWKKNQNLKIAQGEKDRKARQKILNKAITYAEVAELYLQNKDDILPNLEIVKFLGIHANADAYMCSEDFYDLILEISRGLNTHTQVTQNTINSHMGVYDVLENVLPYHIRNAVEWKTGDNAVHQRFRSQNGSMPQKSGQPHTPANLSAFALPLLDAAIDELCKRDKKYLELKQFATKDVTIYASKAKAAENFISIIKHPLISEQVKNDGEESSKPAYKITNELIKNALLLAGQIPDLGDHLYKVFPEIVLNKTSAQNRAQALRLFKWRSSEDVPFYNAEDNYQPSLFKLKKDIDNGGVLPFSKEWDEEVNHSFAEGLITPFLVKISALVKFGNDNSVEWICDPHEFTTMILAQCADQYMNGFYRWRK